jgi:hypothetical protein
MYMSELASGRLLAYVNATAKLQPNAVAAYAYLLGNNLTKTHKPTRPGKTRKQQLCGGQEHQVALTQVCCGRDMSNKKANKC